jgi:Microfibril-associated/Pre-mRNA processing
MKNYRRDREREEIERRREMPEEERLKEDLERARESRKKDRSKHQFMQKYYHKGAFYQVSAVVNLDEMHLRHLFGFSPSSNK